MEISENIQLFGCDINPLANLITKVKLQGINFNAIHEDIDVLEKNIEKKEYEEYSFNNIEKWFREDIITDLKIIRTSIIKISNKKNRLYFWYMLCDIIRRYSNTRSSTYKLHIKEQNKISTIQNKLIADYLKAVKQNINKFKEESVNFNLYKCDTLKKISEFSDNMFDIVVTSPPYGDNETTVPYGQFSMLALYWIDLKDLELEGWELENYSKIDYYSMGGKGKEITLSPQEEELIKPYIKKISDNKKSKVLKFFSDYFNFMKQLCRVTNKRVIMTLGNRTVDNININLTKVSSKYLEYNGFKNIKIMERKIPVKRIPSTTSRVNNKSVSSMNYEYIIIYDKI